MSESVTENIKFSTHARRCPYCHDTVENTENKCVCNDCLAVSHVECWDEAACCPSCSGNQRLVSEGTSAAKQPQLRSDRQTRVRPSTKGPSLELAPDTTAPQRRTSSSSKFDQLRNSDFFRHYFDPEVQEELRERLNHDRKAAFLNGRDLASWIFYLAACINLFLYGWSILFGMVFTVSLGLSAYLIKVSHDRGVETVAVEADLSPLPVKIVDVSQRISHGCQLVVMALDPDSHEEPDSYYHIDSGSNERLISLEVPTELCRGLARGHIAALISHNHRVLALDRSGNS